MRNLLAPYRHWRDFSGHLRRVDFWLFYLSYTVLLAAVELGFSSLRTALGAAHRLPVATLLALAEGVFIFWAFTALLAAMIRRLRDAGWPVWVAPAMFAMALALLASLSIDILTHLPHPAAVGPAPAAGGALDGPLHGARTRMLATGWMVVAVLLLIGLIWKPASPAAVRR